MNLTFLSALALVIGLVKSFAISAVQQRNDVLSCNTVQDSGEIILLSLKIVEYPVILDGYYPSNTVIHLHEQVTITVINAPTQIKTTVFFTTTSTVTSTISTATVTAYAQATSSATPNKYEK
jgi:hypothetical protein